MKRADPFPASVSSGFPQVCYQVYFKCPSSLLPGVTLAVEIFLEWLDGRDCLSASTAGMN